MTNNLVVPLAGFIAGAGVFVFGFFRHRRANAYKALPCLPIGSLPAGERVFITGKAHSPAHANSPVTKTPCAFYLETTDKKTEDYSASRNAAEYRWERVSTTAYGGFFLQDDSGSALVFPTEYSLDFQKPVMTENDDLLMGNNPNAVRRTEQIIQQGEKVTVLGTPRPLQTLMAELRSRQQDQQANIPPDLLAELINLANGTGASTPCFFGDGVEKVADRAYDDYVAGTASSAALFIKIGALIALISAGFLFHALKSNLPPPVF